MTTKFKFLVSAGVTGQNDIKRLGNSLQGVQGKAKNLGMAVKGVGLAFKALFAAAAIGGFSAVVKGAIDSADAFGKLSTRTGVAADKLQAYVNAGKLADVSQSEIENGLRKLAQTQAEAADGVATYSEAYAKLGLSVKKADGSLKPSDQLLGEIANKFKDLPNGPEKAAVAMDIFGRSGSKLITLLNGGTEALERFNYETSENFAQNAEYFNDQITILQIQFDGFRKQLADALLPALNAILEVFSDLFESGQDFTPLFQIIEGGIRGVASVVLGLVQATKFFVRTLQDLVKIATLVGQGKFGEALGVAQTGLADTRAQFFADMQAQQKTLFGRSEVGTDYGGGGTGTLDMSGRDGSAQKQKSGRQREIVKMSQDEFDLRQAIRDAREAENEVALVAAEFALEAFNIGNKFNGDVLGGRNALLDAELSKNQALKGIEKERAAAAKQAAEEAAAAQQALLEADPGYQMKQQLEELIKLENQVAAGATAIGNAFGNSFKSVIDGSKTAEQALGDMMASVAEHFLDMAAQIIAKQIAMIIYGTIMKALGVGLSSKGSSGVPGLEPNSYYGTGGQYGSFTPIAASVPKAEGGFISSPTNALVGEGGEPEYIIPQSKMRESMSRYSRGARGSAVIPENGASGTSGEAGGAAVAAPIDVRFSVERINEVDYVTAEQFQAGMQRAAQQGAVEGERRALGSIRNSSAVRRRIGV
ncbi:MAG: hypothetical protein EBV86_10940 [Marivivens sp.]|nr:hypothetical protein [Marivivens sp.]NCW69063.1 hypothetical protein [Marivivens sp.]